MATPGLYIRKREASASAAGLSYVSAPPKRQTAEGRRHTFLDDLMIWPWDYVPRPNVELSKFWPLERKLEMAQTAQSVLTPMENDDELIQKLEDPNLHPMVRMEIMKSVGERMKQRKVDEKLVDLVKSNLQTTVSQFGQPRPCAHKGVQVSTDDYVTYLHRLVKKHETKFEEVLEKLGSLNPYDHPMEKDEVLEHQHQLWKSLYLDIIAWLGGPHRLRMKAIDSDSDSDD